MIRIIKLTTGEEIIGKIVKTDAGAVEMTKPTLLVPQMDNNGKVKVNFMPFAAYGDPDKTVGIYPHAIVADYEPSKQLEEHYSQQFLNSIQVVSPLQASMSGIKL